MRIIALLALSVVDWLHRLGGPGLILVGIADNSLVPLPGSMDVFTMLLSSAHRDWWPYYGFMATVGAVVGGYITYRLAEKGGEEALDKKIGRQRAEKVYRKFENKGFTSVMIGAILPPPFPITPFLMGAGILHYPTRKFVSALALGRGIRYFALAYVGHIYGDSIVDFFARYKEPVLYALLSLAAAGGIAALVYFKYYRPRRRAEEKRRGEPVEELPIPGMGNTKLREQQQGSSQDKTAEDQEGEVEKSGKEKKTA